MAKAQLIHVHAQCDAGTEADKTKDLGDSAWSNRYAKAMLNAIHCRLCEAAEQRERTNELLAKLVKKIRPMSGIGPNP